LADGRNKGAYAGAGDNCRKITVPAFLSIRIFAAEQKQGRDAKKTRAYPGFARDSHFGGRFRRWTNGNAH